MDSLALGLCAFALGRKFAESEGSFVREETMRR